MKEPAKSDRNPAPAPRSQTDCQTELAVIDQAHIQNEVARDAFLALAHTALFASSIAFVGNLTAPGPPKLVLLLIAAWLTSVIGLLALTISFHQARRHLNLRRDRIYDHTVKEPRSTDILNSVALWSFPFALISTFLFATANMISS